MTLLFVADLHYALKQFDWLVERAERFDVVAIGGDLLDLSAHLDFDVQILVVERYLRKLSMRTRVLVSSGNHDGDARNAADESVAAWLQELRGGRLAVDFDNVDIDGTVVTICPWWDGPVSREELVRHLDSAAALPKKRWIWVHHAPPDGSPVSWTGRRFVGDDYLAGWIERYQPDLVLSGHVHNAPFQTGGSWIDRIGRTWVINPGRQIGPAPAFVEIDLDTMQAQWLSLAGSEERALGGG